MNIQLTISYSTIEITGIHRNTPGIFEHGPNDCAVCLQIKMHVFLGMPTLLADLHHSTICLSTEPLYSMIHGRRWLGIGKRGASEVYKSLVP